MHALFVTSVPLSLGAAWREEKACPLLLEGEASPDLGACLETTLVCFRAAGGFSSSRCRLRSFQGPPPTPDLHPCAASPSGPGVEAPLT